MTTQSTKPSTASDYEKEPIPAFMKVLNIYENDMVFEEDDLLMNNLSNSSDHGCITEGSHAGRLFSGFAGGDPHKSRSEQMYTEEGAMIVEDFENSSPSPMMIVESFGDLSLKDVGGGCSHSSKDLSFGKKSASKGMHGGSVTDRGHSQSNA